MSVASYDVDSHLQSLLTMPCDTLNSGRPLRHRALCERLVCLSALAVPLAFLWLAPASAWARAGGGGSYGGGGGDGGSGGGGGGGGGGEIFYLLWWLCREHPLIGIPVTIAFVAFIVFGGRTARSAHVTRTIRRGHARQETSVRAAAIERILQHDPAFDEDAFLERAATAFGRVQESWSRQDLAAVRPFISDGIRERFSLQIGMQQAEGTRNQMEDVEVLDAGIAAAFSDDAFDTLHIRIHASAVDYSVDLRTGRRTSGSSRSEEFVEFWSFHRRPGARSLRRPGAIEGHCPRCAAPLEIVDIARCPSCGAMVNSGEFDWVLAEITQDREWRIPGTERGVPGLAELKHRDPAFSIQHVEDRVSVMFWRLRAAEFQRDVALARPVLSPRYEQEFKRDCERMRAMGEFWKEPAVGKVELIDAESGSASAFDRLRVKVRWSGTWSAGDPRGSSHALRPKAIYTHVFVLARRHGVGSVPHGTFTSAGCPNCGAPLEVNIAGACTYCGAEITDGRYDWVLEDVRPYSSDVAFRTDAARPPEDTEFALARDGDAELSLAVLTRVMYSDGQIAPAEREALYRLGAHRNLTQRQVDLLIDSAAVDEVSIPVPADSQQALQHLEQLVHAVLADGQLTSREKKLLTSYARRVELSPADVKLAITRERRRAYRSARAELRRVPRAGRM